MAAYCGAHCHSTYQPRLAEKMLWSSARSPFLQVGSSSPPTCSCQIRFLGERNLQSKTCRGDSRYGPYPSHMPGITELVSKEGFGSYPQEQQLFRVSVWRRHSRRSMDLEHVLFRNILDLSFPFATCPFVLFLIYNLLKMSLDRALVMPSWNLL